ncbi:DUF1648 domain-containing protein [Actinocorallia aurantiaca]|uniref:DUF1648 domain-containing protein n=1 Tax=Actinocorallia aurantiaca TaxID=46204 RepID=A0ABN3U3D0_9ACTN
MKRLLIPGAVVALALAALPAVWWGRLPDPLASHWNAAGEPDGSLSKAAALALPLVIWIAGVLLSRKNPPIVAGLGFLVLALQGMTVWANLDRADWQDARHLPVWMPVLLVALPLLGGWLGLRFTTFRDVPSDPVETLDLPAGERAVWVARCTSPVLLAVGFLCLLGGAVSLLLGGSAGPLSPVLLLVGLLVVLLGTIRVQVSERGIAVAYGPWAFPVWRKGLTKITAARTEELRPSQVGGWGLRGLPGRATLMLRGGECLVLEYPNGGRFAISVDGAADGAALLNTLKAR